MNYHILANVLDCFIDIFILYLFFTEKIVFSSREKNHTGIRQFSNLLKEEIEKNNELTTEIRRLESEKYKLVQELNKHS